MANTRPLSLTDFIGRFPDDDTCLEIIFRTRYGAMEACPKCQRPDPQFYRISTRKAYVCGSCGKQIYPCSGTPMQGSTTRLTVWFQALFMFSISRNGVSAYELERALGVDYRTAWRIGNRIRMAMVAAMESVKLSGKVEADETLLGGVARGGKRGWGAANKVCLVGVVQRGGGVRTVPVPARNRENIMEVVRQYVEQGSTVNTDEFRAYSTLPAEGYQHQTVVHSKYQWAQGDAHTNSIEGYWSNLKKSIRSTHTRVSPAYLSTYLAEFDYRHTNRNSLDMFERMFLLMMAV